MLLENIKEELRLVNKGDLPLPQLFWTYYMAVLFCLIVFGSVLGPFGSMLHIAALGWAFFMIRPVWRAADKHKGIAAFAQLSKPFVILVAAWLTLDILII